MKEISLEYIFPTSIKFLFKRFSTAAGLSEWFADDVWIEGDIFKFKWKDTQSRAKVITDYNKKIIFHWLDSDIHTFIEFINNQMGKNTVIKINEKLPDDEDEDEMVMFWDNQIHRLKRKLGIL